MIKLFTHITISVLVLLSTAGFSINMHYCQDQLYDLSFIAPAEDCCATDESENNCHHDANMDNSNHCNDETIMVESTNNFVVSTISFNFENIHTSDFFFTTQLLFENRSASECTTFDIINYKKPPIPREIVLSQIQSFLI